MKLRPMSATLIAACAVLAAAPLHAQESFYEDHPDRGLRFADMEFALPTDPMLPSWVGFSHVIHTPDHYLADASARLHAAIPAGTDAATAVSVLAKAGAHCGQPTGSALTCRYHDVETPTWGDQQLDSIRWTVTMPLADGRVTDLAVARDWTRQ